MPWGPVIQLMPGLTGGCASSRLSASANLPFSMEPGMMKLPLLVKKSCSIAQSHLTLCNLDCSMPGFPVPHYLLEFVQTSRTP